MLKTHEYLEKQSVMTRTLFPVLGLERIRFKSNLNDRTDPVFSLAEGCCFLRVFSLKFLSF